MAWENHRADRQAPAIGQDRSVATRDLRAGNVVQQLIVEDKFPDAIIEHQLVPAGADVLPATPEEIEHVTEYMTSEAADLTVTMVQKVYSENMLDVRHDVWDVHTDKDRWWVITEPMNLYAQDQFPNMDLALTFHIGLCLRIPRSQKQKLSELPIEPFAEVYRYLDEPFCLGPRLIQHRNGPILRPGPIISATSHLRALPMNTVDISSRHCSTTRGRSPTG